MPLHKPEYDTERRHHRLAIVDRALLAEALTAVVGRYGSQAATARATGIQQSQLSRLLNSRSAEIGLPEFRKLMGLFDPAERKRIEAAFFSPKARERLVAYNQWLSESISRLKGGSERLACIQAINRAVSRRFPWIYKDFLKKLKQRGLDADRITLALLRIVEPLADSISSGSIERAWRELSDTELRELVESGIRREEILLLRTTSFLRSQQRNPAKS